MAEAARRTAPLAAESDVAPPPGSETPALHAPALWAYLAVGALLGIVITKGEVISWFRIQGMFRLQGFHRFGVFATALPIAILTVQAAKH